MVTISTLACRAWRRRLVSAAVIGLAVGVASPIAGQSAAPQAPAPSTPATQRPPSSGAPAPAPPATQAPPSSTSRPPAQSAPAPAGRSSGVDPVSALKLKPAAPGEYVIGRGDVVEIAVWDNAAVSRTVLVRPDGRISLPLLDDVQAAGLTPMQLREYLEKSLAKYIDSPAVSVIVREVHSYQVSVVGQVRTPGRFQLTDHATVLDVLAMAGGLTEFADRSRITVLRRVNSETRYIPFAYNRVVSRDGSNGDQDNFYLQGDDIILVP